MANSMSLLNLNQSELITLKEKAEKILEELQMNCDFDYENYHEALDQLTAIDGWTEGQSTDEGYAEGHDRYASQEEYVEKLKARLDRNKAETAFFEHLMFLVFETDYMDRIQRNIFTNLEYLEEIARKYKLVMPISRVYFFQVFRNDVSRLDITKCSVWEQREILAYFKHKKSCVLIEEIQDALRLGAGLYYITFLMDELNQMERLEEIITLGMLDVHIEGQNNELSHMLNHDFGKDAGINFRELRAQKAQAKKVKLDTKLKLSERVAK